MHAYTESTHGHACTQIWLADAFDTRAFIHNDNLREIA